MLILAGPLLQGPARGGGRSGAGGAEARHQEGEQSSDGDTSEYSGSSSEEVDAPVSVGTKRDYTRQRTAAPGPVNSVAAEEMDRDGADDGGGEPCWAEMTRRQKKKRMRRGGR